MTHRKQKQNEFLIVYKQINKIPVKEKTVLDDDTVKWLVGTDIDAVAKTMINPSIVMIANPNQHDAFLKTNLFLNCSEKPAVIVHGDVFFVGIDGETQKWRSLTDTEANTIRSKILNGRSLDENCLYKYVLNIEE